MDKLKTLTPEVLRIIVDKGTERPHSGEHNGTEQIGTYLCRRCGLSLFYSDDKFVSSCGWPSFDDYLPQAVDTQPDVDGIRNEIVCHRCSAHLGHVFMGEGHTPKNCRHCVNSQALDFLPGIKVTDTEEAIYAGGCFWGVQYYLDRLEGVLKTEVGYCGGDAPNPNYDLVCQQGLGFLEAIRVIYDPKQLDYKTLTKYFFEIHDPTQINGQGPDIGPQYLSAIFAITQEQQTIADELIAQLKQQGYTVATTVREAKPFWKAEAYHQSYYQKKGALPYCHTRIQRFS